MERLARTFVYTLLVATVYNIIVVIGAHLHAPVLSGALQLIDHGHGFTAAIAAACVATTDLPLLACVIVAILLTGWPVDLVHLAFALVGGGLLGEFIKRFVRAHRHDPEPVPSAGRDSSRIP